MIKSQKIKKIILSLSAICSSLIIGLSMSVVAKASVKDQFLFPSEVEKNTYLGMQTQLARIMPADEDAKNYRYGVVFKETNTLIETNGYSFLPEKEGTYKCIYSYELDGEKYEYTYEIVASIKEGPVFRSEPNFPYAFVSGSTYTLPTIEAYDYTGGTKKNAEVKVTATLGGVPVTITDNKLVPISQNVGDKIDITYAATSAGKSEIIEKTIPIVNVYNQAGEVDMSKLFYQTGALKTYANDSCVGVTTTSDLDVQAVNLLAAEGLEVRFAFGENKEAEKLTLKMESLEDPSVALSLSFNKGKQSTFTKGTITLNNTQRKDYKFSDDGVIKVVFSESKSAFLGEANELLFDVDTDLQGGSFTGFPGGLVKVTLSIEDVYGTCDVNFYQINFQKLTNAKNDFVKPTLSSENKSSEAERGKEYVVKNIYAVDVIDPSASVDVCVLLRGQEIEYTFTKDGILSFTPDKAGSYTIKYSTCDKSDNEGDFTKIVFVKDQQKPELTVDKTPVKKAALNQTIKLPGATATDNDDVSGLSISLYIVSPTAEMRRIAIVKGDKLEETPYKFEDKGTYYVRYMVTDEYENFVIKEFKIVCGG